MNEDILKKVDEFFSRYRLRKYDKGQILLLNGDDTDYVYLLVSGIVKVYDVSYRGDEIILNIFKPPAFFPMSLALNKVTNPYIYEAESQIEVRQAPADEVVTFITENPDVTLDLLSRVYTGVDGILGRMATIMSGSAKSRLLYEIVLEVRRFGTPQNGGDYVLDISERDLAARAGLSRETVSRELHKLKDDGLVATNASKLVIKSLKALEEKLGQEV